MQKRQQPVARRALGLFLLVWLNIALQPCVMALGSAPADHCPNCPPEIVHELASNQMPCASSTDCTAIDQFNYDGRDGSVKIQTYHAEVLAILPWRVPPTHVCAPLISNLRTQNIEYLDSSPALNILNCVYLN